MKECDLFRAGSVLAIDVKNASLYPTGAGWGILGGGQALDESCLTSIHAAIVQYPGWHNNMQTFEKSLPGNWEPFVYMTQ